MANQKQHAYDKRGDGGGAPAMFVTSYTVGQKDNRTMFPALKNNAAAGYKDPVKIELFERCRSTEFRDLLEGEYTR